MAFKRSLRDAFGDEFKTPSPKKVNEDKGDVAGSPDFSSPHNVLLAPAHGHAHGPAHGHAPVLLNLVPIPLNLGL